MSPEPTAGLDMGMGATTNSPRRFFCFFSGIANPLECTDWYVVCDETCAAREALVA